MAQWRNGSRAGLKILSQKWGLGSNPSWATMIGNRVMDKAWLRDSSDVIHVDEALLLAVLLHAKGKSRKNKTDMEHVARLMKDPNRNRRRAK